MRCRGGASGQCVPRREPWNEGKGISATTYPSAVEELKGFGVEVETTKHLVTHGNIGTAAGCLAAVDLMGWAIEKLYGQTVRQDVIASVLPVGQGQVCIY